VRGQPNLLEIIRALRPPGRLAGGLDGGKKKGDQNRDDGDDHEQLDQGKTPAIASCWETRLHFFTPRNS
jgi:hypothetical protein